MVLGEQRIKLILTRHLRETGMMKRARVIRELCVAGYSRRADVVLVNGHLSAFEIKGERDDLSRLPGQVKTFSEYFESLTVVCAPRHTSKVIETVPAEIGVWEINDEQVKVVRAATLSMPDKEIWLSHLPVRALILLLKQYAIKSPGKRRDQLLLSANGLSLEQIRGAVLAYLKSSDRIQRSKVVKPSARQGIVNPVEQNLLRVQAYLDFVRVNAGTTQAMPRRSHLPH